MSYYIPVPITQRSGICLGLNERLLVTLGDRLSPVTGKWRRPADFNGDGKPDYLLYKAATRQTAICYLNNNVYARSAWGPTLPVGSSLVAP